ncbi:MAG: TIGR03618 family F420-dependent PPOX class oxidoreductase [Actinomycetota bacterium]
MVDFEDLRRFAADETGLCVVATTRPDGSVHASVVNAGPIVHPVTGAEAVALVVRGSSAKLAHVRRTSRLSITFRRGWQWVGCEGPAEIVDTDELAGQGGLASLLRDVFVAAGGTHDDWDEYDRVMADEGRVAIVVTPERILGVA